MKRHEIYIEFPETWDELSEADWESMLRLRHTVVSSGRSVTPAALRCMAASGLLENRGVRVRLNDEHYLLLVDRLAESLTWLWQEEGGALSLVLRTTRQLMPHAGKWTGPKSHGEDLTFGEFRQGVQHLKVWEQDRNETALAALAGLLYRAGQKNGGRVPYDADSLDDKIKRGRRMQPWQQWGAYAWFAYFCEYLTTGTFLLEGRETTFAPLFAASGDGNTGGSAKGGTIAQVAMTLAESGVFGTMRDVDRTLLLDVMQKLLMDYERLQQLKKRKP